MIHVRKQKEYDLWKYEYPLNDEDVLLAEIEHQELLERKSQLEQELLEINKRIRDF